MSSSLFQANAPAAGFVESDENIDFESKTSSRKRTLLVGCVVAAGALAVAGYHSVNSQSSSSSSLQQLMPSDGSLLSNIVNYAASNEIGMYAEKPTVEVLEYCTSTVYVDCEDVPYCADCFEKIEEAVWEFNTDVRFQECGMTKVEDLCHVKESHLIRCTDRYWNCTFPANTGGEMSKYNIWATIQCYCGLGGKSGNTASNNVNNGAAGTGNSASNEGISQSSGKGKGFGNDHEHSGDFTGGNASHHGLNNGKVGNHDSGPGIGA